MPAHVLNFELELGLGALGGALEGEVLEEVGGAVGAVGFGARAGVDPHADGGGLGVGGVFGGDLQDTSLIERERVGGIEVVMTYSKAIAEGGALGATAMAHRSRQTSDEAWLLGDAGFDGTESTLGTQALVEPQCETPRSHGRRMCGGEERMQ